MFLPSTGIPHLPWQRYSWCVWVMASHPVTELLNCWAQKERYWPETTYSLQNSEIQVIENMGTAKETHLFKNSFLDTLRL